MNARLSWFARLSGRSIAVARGASSGPAQCRPVLGATLRRGAFRSASVRTVGASTLALFAASFCFTIAAGAAASESAVLAWNAAMLQAVRAECTPPPLVVRNLAILHLALEAAHAEDPDGLQSAAVVSIAGCEVASALFPAHRADFQQLRDRQLTSIPATSVVDWDRGRLLAARVLAEREADGASRFVNYVPKSGAGEWRRTSPFFRPPELPQWSSVSAFVIVDPGAYLPPGPPALGSPAWTEALDEIRRLGSRENAQRNDLQAESAVFWSDFSYTCTPPGHWNEIAASVVRERGLDERQTARLFAQLNVAMADAAIVCWQAKYRYNLWRPVTVLEAEGWQPMLNPPPHPEYPSGHSVFSGAAAVVLAEFLGSDECTFSVSSDASPGMTRTFRSFSAAAEEISASRLYGGIHFRFSCEDGLVVGRQIATEVMKRMNSRNGMKVAAR
jgi:hypothetical protein